MHLVPQGLEGYPGYLGKMVSLEEMVNLDLWEALVLLAKEECLACPVFQDLKATVVFLV